MTTKTTSELLVECAQTFVLCGSRARYNTSAQTDWDFYGESDPVPRSWFEDRGFVDLKNKAYQDPNTMKVWRHEEANIDIQIVYSVRDRMVVEDWLKRNHWADQVPKEERNKLYTLLYYAIRKLNLL